MHWRLSQYTSPVLPCFTVQHVVEEWVSYSQDVFLELLPAFEGLRLKLQQFCIKLAGCSVATLAVVSVCQKCQWMWKLIYNCSTIYSLQRVHENGFKLITIVNALICYDMLSIVHSALVWPYLTYMDLHISPHSKYATGDRGTTRAQNLCPAGLMCDEGVTRRNGRWSNWSSIDPCSEKKKMSSRTLKQCISMHSRYRYSMI